MYRNSISLVGIEPKTDFGKHISLLDDGNTKRSAVITINPEGLQDPNKTYNIKTDKDKFHGNQSDSS